MGSIAISENVFRSHWLGKNSHCSLAVMARPPFWFSVTGNKWSRQVQNSTRVDICLQLLVAICISNQS